MLQSFIVRIPGAKVINGDGTAKRAQRFKILLADVGIGKGLLFSDFNSDKAW